MITIIFALIHFLIAKEREIYCEGKYLRENALLSNNITYIKGTFCIDNYSQDEHYQKNNYNDEDFIICKTIGCVSDE